MIYSYDVRNKDAIFTLVFWMIALVHFLSALLIDAKWHEFGMVFCEFGNFNTISLRWLFHYTILLYMDCQTCRLCHFSTPCLQWQTPFPCIALFFSNSDAFLFLYPTCRVLCESWWHIHGSFELVVWWRYCDVLLSESSSLVVSPRNQLYHSPCLDSLCWISL